MSGMTIQLIGKCLWVVTGLAIAWLAVQMGVGRLDEPGAGMMSAGLGGVIALIGLGGVVNLLMKRALPRETSSQEPWMRGMVVRVAGVVLLLIIYVVLFERIGFLVLTSVLMAILFGGFAGIRWISAIALAVTLSAANYVLFKLALGTQLPAGILAGILG